MNGLLIFELLPIRILSYNPSVVEFGYELLLIISILIL